MNLETTYKVAGGLLLGFGLITLFLVPALGFTMLVIAIFCGLAASSRRKDRLHTETLTAIKGGK